MENTFSENKPANVVYTLMYSVLYSFVCGILSFCSHWLSTSLLVVNLPITWIFLVLVDTACLLSLIIILFCVWDIIDRKNDIIHKLQQHKDYPIRVATLITISTILVFVVEVFLPYISIIANALVTLAN